MSRATGIAVSVFGLGVVLMMLVTSPAAAYYNCPNVCNCTVDCSQGCGTTGPPDFEIITCEDYGVCNGMGGCPVDPVCPARDCTSTINGGSSGDTLNGTSAHECINGNGGADTISGDAGDDTIHGGDGNDTMYGGSGNDCIYGDNGSDNANGDSGTDLCDAETEATCEM